MPRRKEPRSRKPKRDFFKPLKQRPCKFCTEKIKKVDYKNIGLLKTFISDRGKILPRRISKICAKHQRQVTRAIKRLRNIAILPYTVE